MSGLIGNPATLRELAKSLKRLPVVVAQDVAAKVAPVITGLAQASYSGGQTVYGDARPEGKHGPLDLVVSGDTQGAVRFVAIGTVVRAVLPTPYAKFLVGKYRILPMGEMPVAWSTAIGAAANDVISRAFGKAGA
jgi:hypothetical protein